MDLLNISRTVWRHKLAVLPVLLLTVFGLLYVTVLAPPTYTLTASYVLIPPPAAPSDEDIQRDPSLGKVRADNPFVRFQSSAVIVDLLARQVDSPANREALIAQGADERFQVLPSNRFGFSSPIVDVVAVASSADDAVSTARLVSASVEEKLRVMQAAQGVDDGYMYAPLLVDFPDDARLLVSNKIRSGVAVLVLGAMLAFAVVSLAESWSRTRSKPRKSAPVHLAPTDASPPRAIRGKFSDGTRRTARVGGSG